MLCYLASHVPPMTYRLHSLKPINACYLTLILLDYLTSYWTSLSSPSLRRILMISSPRSTQPLQLEVMNSTRGKTMSENNIFQERYPASDRINLRCSLYQYTMHAMEAVQLPWEPAKVTLETMMKTSRNWTRFQGKFAIYCGKWTILRYFVEFSKFRDFSR